MRGAANIPEVINNFNAYNNGNVLIGVTGAITLPNFDPITENIGGAGIIGTYDTGIPGFYGPMKQEVPFRVLDEDIFSLMNPLDPVDLTFRATQQSTVRSTGALDYSGMRVVERGRFSEFVPGKFELGKQMESKLTLEILYILIELRGRTLLELDKLNSVFVVNGRDLLEKVRAYS